MPTTLGDIRRAKKVKSAIKRKDEAMRGLSGRKQEMPRGREEAGTGGNVLCRLFERELRQRMI